MKFVDEAKIVVESGKGGAGAVSFRREKFIPRGGPDGGDGGRGGHIIFKGSHHLNSLLGLRYQKTFKARGGEPGGGSQCTGKDGEDLILEVPLGTSIRDLESQSTFEIKEHGQEIIFLQGGRGGKGNAFFKTNVNQAPTHAQPGEEGQKRDVHLEIKLLADVGIVGLPNAGKSLLISKISAAKPKVADYPFTTLVPNLGVVQVADGHTFVVADIPGLIPNASQGAGLGIRFLKHIEKTKCFIHLIDISVMNDKKPEEAFDLINAELRAYDDLKNESNPLSQRPQLVVLNKVDLVEKEEVERLKTLFRKKGYEVMEISALTGFGLRELVFKTEKMVRGDLDE